MHCEFFFKKSPPLQIRKVNSMRAWMFLSSALSWLRYSDVFFHGILVVTAAIISWYAAQLPVQLCYILKSRNSPLMMNTDRHASAHRPNSACNMSTSATSPACPLEQVQGSMLIMHNRKLALTRLSPRWAVFLYVINRVTHTGNLPEKYCRCDGFYNKHALWNSRLIPLDRLQPLVQVKKFQSLPN